MPGIDWRNRFGQNWITSIRNQMCQSCWAHAATALIEGMVRIEHSLWTARSEGDIRVGTGKRCADGGNDGFALDWVRTNGIVDPECFPDTFADIPHVTTADRAGRTLRLPSAYTSVGSIQDQKTWIDTVGPLSTYITAWQDFLSLGTGVYRRQATVSVGGQPNFGIIWDGRPFWIGDFNGNGRSDVLFYYPGDSNWWRGSGEPTGLSWSFAGNTSGFGNIWDGRPIWIGDFNGNGRSDVLFYYPGDSNWWLGSGEPTGLSWSFAGNTAGFGQVWDGRPFWIGRFSRTDRDEVLFHYPGDSNWWLGSHDGNVLAWSLAGNTAGFGNVADGRPIWIGDFNGNGRSDVLFYYPGDSNWWLGSHDGNVLAWSLAGNTAGFGNVGDGRPIWIGRFSRTDRDEVLFYYPGDGNWWLGTYDGNALTWRLVSNTGTPNTIAGGHFLLVVGYHDPDAADPDGYWIVKNSWAETWGDRGFGKVAYGESDIDAYAKTGLRDTNPDPWAKRRLHGGNLLESGNGAMRRNFEMIATEGGGPSLRHWWRDNSTAGLPWRQAGSFADDAAVCPVITQSTYNRNFDCVYLSTKGQLHHWYYDQTSGQWRDGGPFGPTGVGIPGFLQTARDAPGDFEVVMRTPDARLSHWVRENGATWAALPGSWREVVRFGASVALSGPTLVQSRMGAAVANGGYGELHVVCVLNAGQMQHWSRMGMAAWQPRATFGAGISSPPCMIEGQFGMNDETGIGNFELCVAAGGQVQHWWRANGATGAWAQGAAFGHDVQAVAGLLQGSYGFNLEVIVLTTSLQLQHYWRDGAGWHEGVVIGSA
jgi:Papain family cysteine protease/FG-GAP-like repeat